MKRFIAILIERLRVLDFPMVCLCLFLMTVGGLFVFGTGEQIGGVFAGSWIRQGVYCATGIVCFVVTMLVDYRTLAKYAWIFYTASILLLLAVLLFGEEINNAKSWLSVMGYTVQPAEFAKPLTVLALATLVSRKQWRVTNYISLINYAVLLGLPVFLVARQPDWGTMLVFLVFGAAIVFVAGLDWRIIGAGILIMVITAPAAYYLVLKPHQRDRIQTFINPSEDISNAGWNAHQSLLAVGSGGMWGKGYMQGTQYSLGYLPQDVASTDFIFSVIGEEVGFVGGGAVVCALAGVLICCIRTAFTADDSLGSFICVGVAAIIFCHAYINVGMTVYAAPIIGIPLPFVSQGGSFMISICASVGLVQNVYMRRTRVGRNDVVVERR